MFVISKVESQSDIAAARELFVEYAQGLGFDLCFQSFEAELAGLPGKYAPPDGALLLARVTERLDRDGRVTVGGDALGCVALRKIEEGVCEMKRLYARPAGRGSGLGRALTESILAEASSLGYGFIRLDTVGGIMDDAIALYRKLGFYEIPPYCVNPIPGALYLERRLDRVTSEITE